MRKILNKGMALAAACAMVLGGCGSSAQGTGTAAGTTAASSAAGTAASGESTGTSGNKTVIEYWHCNAETQGGNTVEELVKKFNESNDHIEVVARYNPDMYKGLMQNLQAEEAAGNTPALVQIGWAFVDYFSNNFNYTSPQDAIDKFDKDDPNFLTDNFLPNILDLAVNSDGKQVGIPYSLSNPVLYINPDLLKEAGIDDPNLTTWDQVYEAAEAVKSKTGKYGLYVQEPADFWAQQALIESNGGQLLTHNSDGSYEATFASPEGIEAMQRNADAVADGSALHISWEEGAQSFVDGNCAMLYTTIARRAYVQENAKFNAISVKSPVYGDKPRKVPAGGCFLAITAQDDDQIAAAWEFEKYLYSIESMAAWTIGTGYVPPRKDVADAENGLKSFLAENAMMTPALEQMSDVVKWTAWPGDAGLTAEQALLDMRDQILGGQETAEAGMKAAQDQINAVLKAQ
jgi:multiple sugar transport system substrate-binding protein